MAGTQKAFGGKERLDSIELPRGIDLAPAGYASAKVVNTAPAANSKHKQPNYLTIEIDGKWRMKETESAFRRCTYSAKILAAPSTLTKQYYMYEAKFLHYDF